MLKIILNNTSYGKYPPYGSFFQFKSSHSGNSFLASYFPLKFWLLRCPPPPSPTPLEFPLTFCDEEWIFLEAHILSNTLVLLFLSGNPPQCKAWAGQCFLYLWAVIIEKATITLLVQLNFWKDVRKFILLPVKNYPKMELAVSMLIIPFVFNVSGIHEPCCCVFIL